MILFIFVFLWQNVFFLSYADSLVILKRECTQWLVKFNCSFHYVDIFTEYCFVAELLQSSSLWRTAVFTIYGTSIIRINRNVPWLLSLLSSVQSSTKQQSSSSSSSNSSSRFQLSIHYSSCSSCVTIPLLASSAIQLSASSTSNPLPSNLFGSIISIFSSIFILFSFHLRFDLTNYSILLVFQIILGLLIVCFVLYFSCNNCNQNSGYYYNSRSWS